MSITPTDTDHLIRECIRQFPRMDYYQLESYLREKGISEGNIPYIIRHAQEVEGRITKGKQNLIYGTILTLFGWITLLWFFFGEGSGPVLIFYGAAAVGPVWTIWGWNMLRQTKPYR